VVALLAGVTLMGGFALPSSGRDRPHGAAQQYLKRKLAPAPEQLDTGGAFSGVQGSKLSKKQIERFRCRSRGNPAKSVDMSCNTKEFGQNYAPDNEVAVAVNPLHPEHIVAGSNDYYYRFNNSTGARQAIVPTGFFTSFDGGSSWLDGQIPSGSGNGAGDPAPAFVARDSSKTNPRRSTVVMAQLSNVGGQGGCCVSQGNISVSRSTDGGVTWQRPVVVFKGKGAGIGPANGAIFWDKEYIAVNNYKGTPSYGRIVVTATKFVNGLQGSYASSEIAMSYSDDGGRTWSRPKVISGRNPAYCTFQSAGPDDGSCDEDQDSYPEFGPDGDLYVHFFNFQHARAWEIDFDFDAQIMVTKAPATRRAPDFGRPVHVVDLEDGGSDMPFTVIGRQTPWGHQIRWNAAGTISVNPTDAGNVVVTYADRGRPNPNATEGCYFSGGEAPDYDPCNSGPGSDTNVYISQSFDGGRTWGPRELVDAAGGRHQWFPWMDHLPDGRLAIAWDEDTERAVGQPIPANDRFRHVLWVEGSGKSNLLPNAAEDRAQAENIDVSVTHWTGQYVPQPDWPTVCGPEGYSDPPIENAAGKDCNVFHGDYTGLATGSDYSVNVVWTGLNRWATSPQLDFYTGKRHDGYAQDAMFARRNFR
jgi:hypothetical protein